jgi:hypothetical protein
MVLSSIMKQIDGHVDGATANMVHWGAWLALTAVLSPFPELKLKLELLGSRYNTNLTKDEMEVVWIETHRASESLMSRVPLSVARGPTDCAGEE